MLEALRVLLIRPLIEVLRLVPLPWRFSVLLLVIVLLLRLIPPGIFLKPAAWLFGGLAWLFRSLVNRLQSLCANRPPSTLIDSIDATTEYIIQKCSRLVEWLQTIRGLPWRWGRIQTRWVFAVAALPALVWFARFYIGDISVARAVDRGFNQWNHFEGWALTSHWAPPPSPESEIAQASTRQPFATSMPTALTASAMPDPPNDPIYVVKRGDRLWGIAQSYKVDMGCIVQANQERYAKFNPDALKIGMELRIPTSDPACKK